MKAARKAATVDASQGRSAKVAPVTRIDSPSAMMMNRAQRSAMCPPSTSQSLVVERPSPGTRSPSDGRSIFDASSAVAQRPKRASSPSARPPAIQNRPESTSQAQMRWKLRRQPGVAACPAAHSTKTERPTCMKVKAPAKTSPLVAEGVGQRGRQDEARQHQHEQQQPHRRLLRVEPVGDPGGEHPHPPHRHEQQQRLERAPAGVRSVEQAMRQLGDREDEDEVEEQLDEGDLAVRRAGRGRRSSPWRVKNPVILQRASWSRVAGCTIPCVWPAPVPRRTRKGPAAGNGRARPCSRLRATPRGRRRTAAAASGTG